MGMPTYDIIGITSHGLFWTVVETHVALIACCLPTLRTLFSKARFSRSIRHPIESTTVSPTNQTTSNKEGAVSNSSGQFHFQGPASSAREIVEAEKKSRHVSYKMSGIEEKTLIGSSVCSLEARQVYGV
jgi:hypothetical protein